MSDVPSGAAEALAYIYQIEHDDRRIVCTLKLFKELAQKTDKLDMNDSEIFLPMLIDCFTTVSSLDPALIETDEIFQHYLNNKAFW